MQGPGAHVNCPGAHGFCHLVYSSGHRFSGQALKSVNLLCISHVTLTGCFYYYYYYYYYYYFKYYSLAAFDL